VLGAESLNLSLNTQTHNLWMLILWMLLRITKLPAYTVNSPPNHSLALSHPACIVCIVGVRERGIAPFLASVTDNGFKSVCQMTWIYSITQPHTDVHRIHISSSSHTSGK